MTASLDQVRAALADRYAVDRELGAGGMATVFLADDLKHKRKVALKVLRPELAAVIGAERFLAEIETTANLQHPHILPLFDSGEVDGTVFYVMPYIQGESLRDRLTREKQLPVEEAVRLARETAGALDYAHRHDVIHRDIKPENILLHDGQALVADFGIALAASGAGGTRMTETGMSLGTPHYMSPEQAMGERDISARSDVYALGVVLYEMLVGEPPFNGPTAQAIVAQVVTESPRGLTARRGSVPANVEAATLTALEKLPADRFGSAAEFAAALADPSYRRGTTTQVVSAGDSGPWKGLAVTFAGVAVGLALLAGWSLTRPDPEVPESEPSFQYVRIWSWPPSDAGWLKTALALAPDGSAMVFIDTVGGSVNLWLKERGELEPVLLAGTRNGYAPFFSPDGRWITFSAGGDKLLRVPRRGGSAVTVSDSGGAGAPGVWLDDSTVVFMSAANNLIYRLQGSAHTRLFNSEAQNFYMRGLAVIPGRQALLVSGCGSGCFAAGGAGDVYLLDLTTGDVRTLVEQALDARYVDPGLLVYSRLDGGVFAAPFDREALSISGVAVPVLGGVQTGNGEMDIVIGDDGTVVFLAGQSSLTAGESQVVWVDPSGRTAVVDSNWVVVQTPFGGPALSPDGTRLAIHQPERSSGEMHLYVKRLPDGPLSRLTTAGTQNIRATWSPQGDEIVYISNRDGGKTRVWRQRADGSGQATLMAEEERPVFEGRMSPDGEWLLYRTDDLAPGQGDILARRLTGDTTPVTLVATPFEETGPTVSPDGRWLAYVSDITGRKEVYVRPFPQVQDGQWQVSTEGGSEPLWAPDGSRLYYRAPGDPDRVMAADLETESGFAVGARRRLFQLEAHDNNDSRYWDIRPDGERFLMVVPAAEAAVTAESDVVLVRDWFTAVREAVAEANE